MAAGISCTIPLGTPDYSYQLEIAKRLTCAAVSITSAEDAPVLIDHAIRTALREKKPAYIEIACNVAPMPCPRPGPVGAILADAPSDPETLKLAVDELASFIAARKKPIMLVGSRLRAAGCEDAAIRLADALGCAVTTMAAAKSFFPRIIPPMPGPTGAMSAAPAHSRSLTGRMECCAWPRYSTIIPPLAGPRGPRATMWR